MNETPCEDFQIAAAAELAGELEGAERERLLAHLAACPRCAGEAAALGRLWRGLEPDAGEGPSPFLAARFERALAREIEAQGAGAAPAPRVAVGAAPLRRWGALAATLAAGLALGYAGAGGGDGEIAGLRQEVGALRETMALTLLGERSASDRLRAVAYGRETVASDPRVADALLSALAGDPDVNVRLAALEALAGATRLPRERARWVRAVAGQDSPLVQLSAIDLLLASEGDAARRDLESLLANPDLDPTVASYLRSRLGRRI